MIGMLAAAVILGFTGCSKQQKDEWYYPLPAHTWERFNILRFEIPVEKTETGNWDVVLFTWLSPGFEYSTLDFNMTLTTATGEERINEYQLPFKAEDGSLIKPCSSDSCQASITLKKSLRISKPGILTLELENLTPRLKTEGVFGIGIRLTPVAE